MKLIINKQSICLFLLLVVLILLIANITGLIHSYSIDKNLTDKVVSFDFNSEHNIPTFFSSFLFLINSFLLVLIAYLKKEKHDGFYAWYSLSLIFLFLSMDEILMFHERISVLSRELLSTSGVFYFAWIIPYSIFVVFSALISLKLFLNLPKRTKYLFLISGAIFLLGSLGFEMIGGRHVELHTRNNLTYAIYYTIEEFLEMIGLVTFIYALLDYIENFFGNQINLQFK